MPKRPIKKTTPRKKTAKKKSTRQPTAYEKTVAATLEMQSKKMDRPLSVELVRRLATEYEVDPEIIIEILKAMGHSLPREH